MRTTDFGTDCWKRLAEHVGDRIADLRKANDQMHPIEETARIRGGISELSKILDLAEQASSSPAVDPGELTGDDYSNGA